MFWVSAFKELLIQKNPQAIKLAHEQLLTAGYSFVGFHGSNLRALKSILRLGFDPSKAGSASGLARGMGFYVSADRGLADDFADNSTQTGDPDPFTGIVPRYAGDQGQIEVLRVYARNFEDMQLGTDYVWGVMSSAGDPNQDKRLSPRDTGAKMAENQHELEIVFRPSSWGALFVLPSLGRQGDATLRLRGRRALWKAHESPI